MVYPSIQAMKDAMGDIVLFTRINQKTGAHEVFTFDQLPAAAQTAVFQFIVQGMV